jgi:hypothetical protein
MEMPHSPSKQMCGAFTAAWPAPCFCAHAAKLPTHTLQARASSPTCARMGCPSLMRQWLHCARWGAPCLPPPSLDILLAPSCLPLTSFSRPRAAPQLAWPALCSEQSAPAAHGSQPAHRLGQGQGYYTPILWHPCQLTAFNPRLGPAGGDKLVWGGQCAPHPQVREGRGCGGPAPHVLFPTSHPRLACMLRAEGGTSL